MLNKKKKQRLIFLLAYVILACAVVYFWRPVYLVSIVLVLVPPAVINFLWLKKSRFKILLFSVLTTLLFAPPVELAARLANAWDVQSILPRLFGIAPLENLSLIHISEPTRRTPISYAVFCLKKKKKKTK